MIQDENFGDADGSFFLKSVKHRIDIQFENLCYVVNEFKYGFWPVGEKRILHNMSGFFHSGKLTAVIGESGCGKTTLMDIICGYRCKGISGRILVNGDKWSKTDLIKRTCYVRQDAVLQPLTTVYEAMTFVANLKLKQTMSQHRKESVVRHILEKLYLCECQNTLTKNLSGGQQKRLAIALELISGPSVIVLDEPITGLDSTSARECVKILQDLAGEGRTVICSIHQPSMSLLTRFDSTYVVCKGRCLYQGTVDNIVPFLASNSVPCPVHYNPFEYILESCGSGDVADILIQNTENGKSQKWMQETAKCKNPTQKLNMNAEAIVELPEYIPSFSYQFKWLVKRKLRIMYRDPLLSWIQLISSIAEGIGVGFLFYNKGNMAEWIHFNYNMIFFVTLTAMCNGLMSRIITFPLEVIIMKREYFNRWYSIKAYWLAASIGDVPILALSTSLTCILCYYLVGFSTEGFRIARFTGINVALALMSQDYGIFLGTIFSMKNGLVFGIFSMAPWILFSGFFLYYRDCTFELCRRIFDVSALRKAFEETLRSVYGYNQEPLNCDQVFCYYKYPDVFLKQVDVEYSVDLFWYNLAILTAFYLCAKVVAMLTLKFKIMRGK